MKSLLSLLSFLLFVSHISAQTWQLLSPVKTGSIARNCSFIDENNGYMVLQAEGEVYGTTDGGVTWNKPWTPGVYQVMVNNKSRRLVLH